MINPGLISGSLGCLSAGMIPYRSALETARIAIDPVREREFSLPIGLAVDVGSRVASVAVPPLFRLSQEIKTIRREGAGVAIRNLLARLSPEPSGPRVGSQSDFQFSLKDRFQPIFRSHPYMSAIRDLWARREGKALLDRIQDDYYRVPVFLIPVLQMIVSETAARCPDLQFQGVGLGEQLARRLEYVAREEKFPLSMFGKSTLRGTREYERDLFGKDILERIGVKTMTEDTSLWRMVAGLSFGGVLADWGSGAGGFGYEMKERRPDLKIISVDLRSPEEILSQVVEPPFSAEVLRRKQDFLTGDALEMSLPRDRRADLLVQVFVIPWVPDPLRLFAHMYNQVKPGGVLLSTMQFEARDTTKSWTDGKTVVPSMIEDLRDQGVEVEATPNFRTVAVRRADERRLEVGAELLTSSYETFSGMGYNFSLYHSFYRPGRRWVNLV